MTTKKMLLLICLLVFCFFLCACASKKDWNVRIVSNGKEYGPLENYLCTFDSHGFMDGTPLTPQSAAMLLTAIPYADDLKIVFNKQSDTSKSLISSYTLYDDKYERLYQDQEFSLPADKREYILCVQLAWVWHEEDSGEYDYYTVFEYWFKISNMK